MIGRRFEFDGRNEERGGQQFVSGRGAYRDGHTGIHRIETFGLATSPPKGAKGLLISPNGNPDEAYVLGGEHPQHRPGNLPAGGTALYDGSGNIISLVGAKIRLVAPLFEFVGNMTVQGNVTVSGSVTDGDGNNGA
ncbi:phage baseplate assembly protein [Rhizobium sp. RU36D]|uniref:phage baseplate assembly protein domain-containing protein n=1 Tax=Rhizobium sp. RU36D TaxID=1907415 RepID=UPI0009D7D7CB|nr:phage baseplate assembly protein [Rhizobium sp. RU36D]SMD18458.1 Bacteriophage Mu Gp45 protein [Rhizobium sp. RU36D]